jgi:hypothetical protein
MEMPPPFAFAPLEPLPTEDDITLQPSKELPVTKKLVLVTVVAPFTLLSPALPKEYAPTWIEMPPPLICIPTEPSLVEDERTLQFRSELNVTT